MFTMRRRRRIPEWAKWVVTITVLTTFSVLFWAYRPISKPNPFLCDVEGQTKYLEQFGEVWLWYRSANYKPAHWEVTFTPHKSTGYSMRDETENYSLCIALNEMTAKVKAVPMKLKN